MATVTTPAGDVLEGVTGDLLEYYRAEGYAIVEDEVAPESQFPQVHGDVTVGPSVETVYAAGAPVSEVIADALADRPGASSPAPDSESDPLDLH